MTQVSTGEQFILGKDAPLGVGQLTGLTTAKGFTTIPQNARYAIVQCTGKSVRYSDDGVAPTESTGITINVGQSCLYNGDLAAIKFIETAATAVIDYAFYA